MNGIISKQALDDLTARIKDRAVLDAFSFVLQGMSELGRYDIRDNTRGKKKSVHFATGRVSYYAFVANNHWLLWYFRKPGFRDKVFSWESLRESFSDLETSKRSDPDKAEAVLRIENLEQARDVLAFVSRSPH